MALLKQLYLGALIILCGLCLAACAAPIEQALPEEAPAVFYNDYLGISFSVPPGWHIVSLSPNLNAEAGKTVQPQLTEYAGGSSRMELIDMQSSPLSSDENHSRFYAYGEILPAQIETAEYVELFISLLEADSSDFTYTLNKREQVSLARHNTQRICLNVTGSHGGEYVEEYYIIRLEQAFLVLYINYWPQEDASRQGALAVLESITLPQPPEY